MFILFRVVLTVACRTTRNTVAGGKRVFPEEECSESWNLKALRQPVLTVLCEEMLQYEETTGVWTSYDVRILQTMMMSSICCVMEASGNNLPPQTPAEPTTTFHSALCYLVGNATDDNLAHFPHVFANSGDW